MDKSPETIPPKEFSLKIFAKTEANFQHPEINEDAIAFDQKDGWAVLLDGMGGLDAGDKASKMAKDVIVKRISRIKENTDPDKARQEMVKSFNDASEQVRKKIPRSGTTAVALKIVGRQRKVAVIASVGDSRAYIFRDENLRQITEDDSVISLVDRERFDETDGSDIDLKYDYADFSRRNQITQYLGSNRELDCHLYEEELMEGDKIILTSDGVHDNLRTSEIRQIVGSESEIGEELVKAALERSKDNLIRSKPDDVSVVVMELKR